MKVRINKYIATSGICSRRKADNLISYGKVKVNGKTVQELGLQIDTDKDIVFINDKKIEMNEKKIYIMLNKPIGYITTNSEQFGRKSTVDLIKEDVRVFPIGRLDMDTEGLLLFTNDGEFSNLLMHPKNKIEKTYIVKTNSPITKDKIDRLKSGIDIGGYITKEAKVYQLANNQLEIIISEGKNRQIRRMCEAVNINILNLKRVKIGCLELLNLRSGKYRYLNDDEIKNLKNLAKGIY